MIALAIATPENAKKTEKVKKPKFRVKSVVGKEAYAEEGAERIGTVVREVLSADGKVVGYEVVDEESKTSTYLPEEQVMVTKRGLIVQPLWYTEALKFIRKLELQESVMPEVRELVSAPLETARETLSKIDPGLIALVEEANKFKESIEAKFSQLEAEAGKVREEIIKAASEHLIDKVQRKEFTEKMLALRRRAQLLDSSIKKCQELSLRLEASPFVLKTPPTVPSAVPSGKISCPYMDTCPILKKGAPPAAAEIAKPFRVVKMAEMKKKLELEAKKVEEDMRKRLIAEFGIKPEVLEKLEAKPKEELPEKKARKGLLAKLRAAEKEEKA
ncbi:MAG: hypothetical protein QME47_05680 [Candidatus Thermoplasmatota archaeon]|nr:hypothetical protein [Candidatus Thermoplasmatota archaeon]